MANMNNEWIDINEQPIPITGTEPFEIMYGEKGQRRIITPPVETCVPKEGSFCFYIDITHWRFITNGKE